MNFIKTLIEKGYEVHTIAPKDEFTHYLTDAGCIHHTISMDSRGANPIKDSLLIGELWWTYRKVNPDIVLHYTIKPNIYGTIAATLLKIPVINNVCGLGTVFLKKDLVSFIAIQLYKWAFRYPKKVFFQNPDDLSLFKQRGLVPHHTADLIPGSGIDLDKFKPLQFKRNNNFTFLLISRLITDKGVLEYVEAVRKLKTEGIKARFQILGPKDPEHRRGIKEDVIDSWITNNTIEYLGTTDNVVKYIEQADCIVLPSYREGTPRTLLEASSSQKPIIATDVPGCHNIVVDNYNGLLCKLKDSDDLARKMVTMTEFDDATLIQFGKNGRKKVEQEFNDNIVINKYIEAIATLKKAS